MPGAIMPGGTIAGGGTAPIPGPAVIIKGMSAKGREREERERKVKKDNEGY